MKEMKFIMNPIYVYKTIRDGYIATIYERGHQEGFWYGFFDIVNGKPKQIPVSKAALLKEKKRLEKAGYKILMIEIAHYEVDVDDPHMVDPFKTVTIFNSYKK